MELAIDYYFLVTSPWTYLGASRFEEIAHRHGAAVNVKPVDFMGRVFPAVGAVPVAQRPKSRQAYRIAELDRWRRHLGMPLYLRPANFPVDHTLAHLMIVAARESELNALRLSRILLRAIWADQENLSDEETLMRLAESSGIDGADLVARAREADIEAIYRQDTEEAVERQVFGAPTYVVGDALFWGQDRLDFLDRHLAQAYAPPEVRTE